MRAATPERDPAIGRALWRTWLWLGVASALLHGLNLAYVLHQQRSTGIDLVGVAADTRFYLNNGEALFDGRWLAPLYRERPLYSFLLGGLPRLGLPVSSVLWITVFLEIPATMAMGLLAWSAFRRRAISVVAALLYVVYPNTYQLGALLMPDLLHLQFGLMAIAASLAWVTLDRKPALWAAALFWPLAHLTRPTLMPAIGLLVLLFDRSTWRRRAGYAALAAAMMVWPLVNTALNRQWFGVTWPFLAQAELLHSGVVPRMKAWERNKTEGGITRLYTEEREIVARGNPDWIHLGYFEHKPPPADFGPTFRRLVSSAKEYIGKHPDAFRAVVWDGFVTVAILRPPRFHPQEWADSPDRERLYPDWSNALRRLFYVAMLLTLGAVVPAVAGGDRRAVLFLLALAMMTTSAWTTCWWDSHRVRVVFDCLLLPLLALGLCTAGVWAWTAAVLLLGYLPMRLGWFGPAGLAAVVILLALLQAAIVVNQRLKQRRVSQSRPLGAGAM